MDNKGKTIYLYENTNKYFLSGNSTWPQFSHGERRFLEQCKVIKTTIELKRGGMKKKSESESSLNKWDKLLDL